jgi:hypothetical protein
MGDIKHDWQDSEYVLRLFGNKKSRARANYRAFLEKGIAQGKRPDLWVCGHENSSPFPNQGTAYGVREM